MIGYHSQAGLSSEKCGKAKSADGSVVASLRSGEFIRQLTDQLAASRSDRDKFRRLYVKLRRCRPNLAPFVPAQAVEKSFWLSLCHSGSEMVSLIRRSRRARLVEAHGRDHQTPLVDSPRRRARFFASDLIPYGAKSVGQAART